MKQNRNPETEITSIPPEPLTVGDETWVNLSDVSLNSDEIPQVMGALGAYLDTAGDLKREPDPELLFLWNLHNQVKDGDFDETAKQRLLSQHIGPRIKYRGGLHSFEEVNESLGDLESQKVKLAEARQKLADAPNTLRTYIQSVSQIAKEYRSQAEAIAAELAELEKISAEPNEWIREVKYGQQPTNDTDISYKKVELQELRQTLRENFIDQVALVVNDLPEHLRGSIMTDELVKALNSVLYANADDNSPSEDDTPPVEPAATEEQNQQEGFDTDLFSANNWTSSEPYENLEAEVQSLTSAVKSAQEGLVNRVEKQPATPANIDDPPIWLEEDYQNISRTYNQWPLNPERMAARAREQRPTPSFSKEITMIEMSELAGAAAIGITQGDRGNPLYPLLVEVGAYLDEAAMPPPYEPGDGQYPYTHSAANLYFPPEGVREKYLDLIDEINRTPGVQIPPDRSDLVRTLQPLDQTLLHRNQVPQIRVTAASRAVKWKERVVQLAQITTGQKPPAKQYVVLAEGDENDSTKDFYFAGDPEVIIEGARPIFVETPQKEFKKLLTANNGQTPKEKSRYGKLPTNRKQLAIATQVVKEVLYREVYLDPYNLDHFVARGLLSALARSNVAGSQQHALTRLGNLAALIAPAQQAQVLNAVEHIQEEGPQVNDDILNEPVNSGDQSFAEPIGQETTRFIETAKSLKKIVFESTGTKLGVSKQPVDPETFTPLAMQVRKAMVFGSDGGQPRLGSDKQSSPEDDPQVVAAKYRAWEQAVNAAGSVHGKAIEADATKHTNTTNERIAKLQTEAYVEGKQIDAEVARGNQMTAILNGLLGW